MWGSDLVDQKSDRLCRVIYKSIVMLLTEDREHSRFHQFRSYSTSMLDAEDLEAVASFEVDLEAGTSGPEPERLTSSLDW